MKNQTRKYLIGTALLGALALGLAPARLAEAQTGGTTKTLTLGGVAYDVFVPQGWDARLDDDLIAFTPPQSRMQGQVADFICFMSTMPGKMDAGVLDYTKGRAEIMRKQYMPWATLSDPSDINFGGMSGGLVLILGNNPDKNSQPEAMVVVSAEGNGNIHFFVSYGLTADVNELASDMDRIVGSVRRGASGGGGGKTKFGDQMDKNRDKGKPPDPPPRTPPPPIKVVDPPWGLEVSGLSGDNWTVAIKGNEASYVFTSYNPAVQVSVTHSWAKDADFKSASKKAKGKEKIGGADARYSEGKNDKGVPTRTYYVVVGDQATIIEVASNQLDKAMTSAWPEFVKGLSLQKGKLPKLGAATGVELFLASGLGVKLLKPWRLVEIAGGRADFQLKEGKVDLYVQLRVSLKGGGTESFLDRKLEVEQYCRDIGGEPKYAKVDYTAWQDVEVMRCKPATAGFGNKKAPADIPQMITTVIHTRSVSFMIFAKASGKDIPEGRIDEFLSALSVP